MDGGYLTFFKTFFLDFLISWVAVLIINPEDSDDTESEDDSSLLPIYIREFSLSDI